MFYILLLVLVSVSVYDLVVVLHARGGWTDDGRSQCEAGRRLQPRGTFLRRYGQTFGSRAAATLLRWTMDVTTDESHETSSPTVTLLLITLCTRNFVGVSGRRAVSTEIY